jgi:pyruvate/2-oxoglutarate/acetoin dehydrogenase E1 component
MDFLPRAMDQLVNHLNILHKLSKNKFQPKVIIRTTIGSKDPLDTGLQHSKDMIKGFQAMLDFPVLDLKTKKDIVEGYKLAREGDQPVMLVERQDLYATEQG